MRLMKQPRSMFVKMLLSITIVLIGTILILFFTLYRYFEREQLNTVMEASGNILGQISYSADYMNDSARNFSLSVFNNTDTIPLMYRDQPLDVMGFYTQMRKLNSLVEMNPFVHSVYIYNNKLDTYYRVATAQNLYTSEQFPDREIVRLIENGPRGGDVFKPIPRIIPADGSNPEAHVYSYMLYDFPKKNTVMGAVIVNIKSSYLQNMIERLNDKNGLTGGKIFIIDSHGIVISGEDSSLLLQDVSDVSYIKTIMEGKADSDHFYDKRSGEMVFYVSSDVLGWKFVRTVPYEAIISQIGKVKTFTIWVCSSLLAAALLAAFIVSRRIYLPFNRLVERVAEQSGSPAMKEMKGDEIRVLSHAFQQSHLKASKFDQSERHMQAEKKKEMLQSVLQNELVSDTIEGLEHKYRLNIRLAKSFIVLLLKIDRHHEFKAKYSPKDRELFRYSLAGVAHELLAESFDNEAFEMDDDKIAVILNVEYDKYETLKRVLGDKIEQIRLWSEAHLPVSFTAAYGYIGEDFLRIKESYEEVLNMAKYRLIFGHSATISPETIRNQLFEKYNMPAPLEKRLLECLVNGRADEAGKCLEEMMGAASKYSYDSLMSFIFYLNSSIYNAIHTMEGSSVYKFAIDFNEFAKKIGQQETLTGINELYRLLFGHIAEIVKESKSKRPAKLVDTIKNLIDSNYKDSSLCLESVASTLNMSKIYVGKVFREACGYSVSDYIMNVRIRKAVELLHEDAKPMSDIIEEIGIENKNYFYKLFKARVGISFGDYRIKCLNEKIEGQSDLM